MATTKLLVGTTNIVKLAKFKDVITGTFPEDAVVTVSVLPAAGGAAIANADEVAMPKLGATSGSATVYQGLIPANAAVVVGAKYKIRVTAISGGSQRRFFSDAVGTEG